MDVAAFNWVDYTALGMVAFSTLISFARGFVREAISLASWMAAVWVAHTYGHDFGMRFLTMVEMGQARSLIASAILFFSVLIAGAFINYTVNSFVRMTGLSAIDRILGMAFGFTRGILLVAVLILVGQMTEFDKKPWWPASQVIPQFTGITDWLKGFVPEQFEKIKPLEQQTAPAVPTPPLQAAPPIAPATKTPQIEAASSGISIKLAPSADSSITITAPAAQAPAATAAAAPTAAAAKSPYP